MVTGIYLHIPFCLSRCSYCDFATGLYNDELADRYVKALIKEIRTAHNHAQQVDTIYFGGGTPSLLKPLQLEAILNALQSSFAIETTVEVTMEMNPGTVDSPQLSEFRSLGINRASFGAQTFDDRELARLGRSHSAAEIVRTYDDLRNTNFDNISFDLIAGLPGQSLPQWEQNVARALELRPEHLSFYLLEVHEGTPLADHIRRGIQPTPDDDLAGVMYTRMIDSAVAAGYQHYEISNLCLPGRESRHNSKYWTGQSYLGFGCSAHSYDGERKRWSNTRDINRYVGLIEENKSPVAEERALSDEDVRAEAVFLGMRLMRGVNLRKYQERFSADLRKEHKDELQRFQEAGLVEFDGDWIKLTTAGALLSNEVFASFV